MEKRVARTRGRMSSAFVVFAAVGTGVVVIAVAAAVVLVVLLVTLSMRGRQKRGARRIDEARRDVDEARGRAAQAERDRDIAREGGENLGPQR